MRIVHQVISGDVAGGQLVALHVARAAKAAGHDVRFLSPTDGPFLDLVRREGFSADVIAIRGAIDIRALARITRAFRAMDVDIVHTHVHFSINVVVRIAGRLAGARVLSHMHIENTFRAGRGRRAQIALDNATARLCFSIIAVSEATRASLVRQGYPADRVVTVHNGIEPAEGATPVRLTSGPTILEVARLAEVKGQKELLKALQALDASAVLVGQDLEHGGAYEGELRREAERLGVADRVVFAGYRDDVPALLAGSDVFCLPSHAEGLPLVVLEAMAQGKPVVATAVGGTPELVLDGETGLLVPPGDVEALTLALADVLGDADRARRLGEAARERARASFSASAMNERVLRMYELGSVKSWRSMANAAQTQADVRRWWTDNPMTYDWRGEIPYPPGSSEHLAEVERRFLAEAWFAQPEGAPPFSALIPFDELRGKDVLEIGCGTGVHTRLLAAAGGNVSAVDLTPTAVELTTQRLALAGLFADVLEADAESLPFADDSFDFVWSWGVIHHSVDTDRVIGEIARVLRPGGRLAFMVYHRRSLTFWVNYVLYRGVLRGGLLHESPDELANRWSDGVIARHYTRRRLTEALRPWFDDIETQVMGQIGEAIPLPSRVRQRVARLVPRHPQEELLRNLGWFLFATAHRKA
ncbi:MAG TPA: glycosyltransferase [Gaiellaceae bacterium]|nr:glycosyltransferase [Gaiellaceae bacterium]